MTNQKRQELFKFVVDKAESLRGSVDGWDFKNYVLGFLFYRYISEDFERYIKAEANAGDDFDYRKVEDDAGWLEGMKDDFIETKGYFIEPSQLFSNLVERSRNDFQNLNEEIGKVFGSIESSTFHSESKDDFHGLFEVIDLNDNKLGKEVPHKNRKLRDTLIGVEEMNIDINEPGLYGDIYEHLIGNYASKAGKSGGEFYTPPEVSELLVHLVSVDRQDKIKTVYDPACGSGSLLLKFQKLFKNADGLQFFGQEINPTTYNLCRMNMFMHGVNYADFDIKHGNTLTHDYFGGMEFDAIVSNPPYSSKWDGADNALIKEDPRFTRAGGFAPKNKADLAFVQHSLHHLDNSGVAAMVCFPGILFREHAEKIIRKHMIDNNYIDAIIQLPERLFFGVGIATCIMVLKKTKQNTDVLFVDASNIYTKATNQNKLSPENIDQILQFYKDRKDIEGCARVVDMSEIKEKEYTLSVDAYVTKPNTQETIDIEAINQEIKERSQKIDQLRRDIDLLIQKLKNLNQE